MPQRSNPFQQVVRLLHEQLADAATVSESKFLIDKRTGEPREVDVVIEMTLGGYLVTIGMECVDRSRTADVEWVERMWARHQDLSTDKLVLVSRSGFTKPALRKAVTLGVVTLSLEEAKEADWAQVVGKLARVYVEIVESQLAVSVVALVDNGTEQIVPVGRDLELVSVSSGASVPVGVLVDKIVAMPEVGRVLLDHMHQKDLPQNVFTADYVFPEPVTALDAAGTPREVTALRIVLDSRRAQTPVDLKHGAIQGAGLAYGEGEGEAGRLRVAVVERESQTPVIEVLQRKGSVWKRLVHADPPRGPRE